jgi:hypothetical protein
MGSLPAQWKASIPFLCSVTYDNTSFTDIPPLVPLSLIDISDYLLEKALVGVIFPVLFALGTAAHEAGNPIILNGLQKSSNLQHVHPCHRPWHIGGNLSR